MKKRDIILIVSVLVFAVLLFGTVRLTQSKGDEAVVYLNNEEYARLPLDKDTELIINNTNTLVIFDGKAYIRDASCPDKVCINMGSISNNTETIVCLPNKIVITIERSK